MCDRTATRMKIRRYRLPSSPNGRMTSSVSLYDESTEHIPTKRFHRKTSFSSSRIGSDSNLQLFDYSTVAEDIERRRRRIRSISNSVLPLPVSSIYRGYLPKSSSSASSKTSDEKSSFALRFTKLENGTKRCFSVKVFL